MEPVKNNAHQSSDNKSVIQTCKQRHGSFTEDFSVATFLMVAYLLETIVQIVLIVNCYRSLLLFHLSAETTTTSSPINWLWILFISWIVTSLLVTLLSIIWTFRGMDFEDRICGQLLCYLMHLFLLGLVWRYLKIALAYEKADVEEFYKLRKLQIYMQAFPLIAIHLAYFINSSSPQSYAIHTTMGWLIAGELCSSIISLSLHPLLKFKSFKASQQDPSISTADDHNHKHKPQSLTSAAAGGVEEIINVTISRLLFLISRLIVVGLLVSNLPTSIFWPMLVIGAHLLTNFMWTCLTTIIFNAQTVPSKNTHHQNHHNSKCNNAKNKNDVESNEWMNQEEDQDGGKCYSKSSWVKKNDVGRHVKNSLVSSYALFWDMVNTSGGGRSEGNLNLWWCLSLPVLLVLVENVAVLIFHMRQQCQTTIFFVIVSGTCLLLFILMTTWNKWRELRLNGNEMQDSLEDGEGMRSEKFSQVLTNSIISDFENCCQEENLEEKNDSWKMDDARLDDRGVSNLGTSEAATYSNNNTCNYGRINETLMTAVKMHQGRGEEGPNNMMMNNENGNEMESFCNIPQNTMSSTSSRNTNTISNLTLQNSPELQKSIKTKSPTIIYPTSRSNSPLVIRKASKIQLINLQKRSHQSCVLVKSHPKIPKEMSRCPVDNFSALPSSRTDNIYEKLIEDAYGILICEGGGGGESTTVRVQNQSENLIKQEDTGGCGAHSTSAAAFSKNLRVLCLKCLGNHDPLLSNCCVERRFNNGHKHSVPLPHENQNNDNLLLQRLNSRLAPSQQMLLYIPRPFDSPKMCSETTEYPTDTEFTCNLYDDEEDAEGDGGSNSSHFSTLYNKVVTYVNLPIQPQKTSTTTTNPGQFNNILTSSQATTTTLFPSAEVRKEFTGMEYVKAWLLMNDVTAKNMLNIKNNIRTNSLNRGKGSSNRNNRHNNKVSLKSKQISRPNSTLANPYRKSQPVFVQLKPHPMQKQHPDLKNCCSAITNNTSISHCHHSVNLQKTSVISKRSCNQFLNTPPALRVFNELQNDLIETVV